MCVYNNDNNIRTGQNLLTLFLCTFCKDLNSFQHFMQTFFTLGLGRANAKLQEPIRLLRIIKLTKFQGEYRRLNFLQISS